MNTGIELSLQALTRIADRERRDPKVLEFARRIVEGQPTRAGKVRSIIDGLQQLVVSHRGPGSYPIDADDACLVVATAAMSVGVPCRFVGFRYGMSWTCRLECEIEPGRWDTFDCLEQSTGREPDERAVGPTLTIWP